MPAMRLTAQDLKRLRAKKAEGEYFDLDPSARGLAFRVRATGHTSWTLTYRVRRRLRRWTIGRYPDLTLADAREEARKGLREVARGKDPAEAKQVARDADSFGELAAKYIEDHAKPRKRTWKDDERLLNAEVLPKWRHKPAKEIMRRDVRALIDAIAKRGAGIQANRLRALLHKVFNFAIGTDVVEMNPVTGTARPGVERQRDRVLNEDEIRQLWAALDAQPAEMAAAFRLRLITAQRGGEVFGMRWSDLDLPNAMWTIPSEQSKNKLPHRVPLSASAVAILKSLRAEVDRAMAVPRKDGKPRTPPMFVLAGARGKRQRAEASATFGIENFVGHDLRRTAASGMASAGVSRLVISKVLNHVERGVTAVYDRHGYDAEKKIALDTWARALTAILERKEGAAVLPFQRS